MSSVEKVEQFATLFDIHFLPQGLCLYQSLLEHCQPFRLWVLCLDGEVELALQRLNLPHVTLIALAKIETKALKQVKASRNMAEYCWTLTPFLPDFVLQQMPQLEQVTYLDADLFFFQSPRVLVEEFEKSGKHVLITEHAFAPEYSTNIRFGRFCVQFMTFRNTEPGRRVLHWWQNRCLEWCYAREEDGKFGDQKYLDDWPERFADEVHVLRQVEKTLAPWNVDHFTNLYRLARPVFYHFHSLRIVTAKKVLLYVGYRVGRGRWFYDSYLKALKSVFCLMRENGMSIPTRPPYPEKFHAIKVIRRVLLKTEKYATI